MPRVVPISVFNIAKTSVNKDAVRRWLEYLNVSDDTVERMLEIGGSDPSLLVALAAKRCYMSFEVGLNPNVTKIRKDFVDYLDNVLKSRHGSVLEHSVYTFAIEGVSRVFTAEMNRHRAGWAISEGSLRFIRFDEQIPFWMPDMLQPAAGDDDDLAERKRKSRDVFMRAFSSQEGFYGDLMAIWNMTDADKNFGYKKRVTSQMRRIVGMGVATGGVWTGNLRALRHVIAARTDEAAEEEIAHVFRIIGKHMIDEEPMLFDDFGMSLGGALVPQYPKV